MNQRIEFVTMRPSREMVHREGAYAFKATAKHHWLQRLCLRILGKLGCDYFEEIEKVERISFEPTGFMDALYRQQRDLFRYFGTRGTVLLIGATDFEQMLDLPEIHHAFSFNGSFNGSVRHGSGRVMGLEVRVIPWMTGMVVLRKEDVA